MDVTLKWFLCAYSEVDDGGPAFGFVHAVCGVLSPHLSKSRISRQGRATLPRSLPCQSPEDVHPNDERLNSIRSLNRK